MCRFFYAYSKDNILKFKGNSSLTSMRYNEFKINSIFVDDSFTTPQ